MKIQKRIATVDKMASALKTDADETTRDILLKRIKIVFGTGLILALIIPFAKINIDVRHPNIVSSYTPWYPYFVFLHALFILIGLICVFFVKKTVKQLLTIDFIILVLNILLIVFIFAVYNPDLEPVFALSLILVLHAAFFPCRVSFQTGLAVISVLAYPLFHGFSYIFVPELFDYWQSQGGLLAFKEELIRVTAQIIIIAIASIVVTKTLYNMRKSLRAAEKLGNYVIEGKIGSGGMGEVFHARHTLMCRPTAIKLLKSGEYNPPANIARFEREVRLSSMLTHPNTITIYDFGRTDDNAFYYVMEYLEGLDLQKIVEKYGPLPPARVIHILIQVCGSLAEAHAIRIIHRDIKPSNIFLTKRGGIFDFVKVLDFGLAKQTEAGSDTNITKTDIFLGTPAFTAPESIYGHKEVTLSADIYTVGAVSYWMLTGTTPFTSKSSLEILVDHMKTIPKKPSEISEISIPKELDEIVMKCMAKEPKNRFGSIQLLKEALESLKVSHPWSQEQAKKWWDIHRPFTQDT